MNSKSNVIFKTVHFDSAEYREALVLRDVILRRPLGLVFSTEELLRDRDDTHIVAIDPTGAVIGCLILSQLEDPGSLQMRQVAVAEKLQRSGVGQGLIKFAEEWAQAHQFHKILLHARDLAVPFYRRLDYQIEDDVFIQVGIPHYTMIKTW